MIRYFFFCVLKLSFSLVLYSFVYQWKNYFVFAYVLSVSGGPYLAFFCIFLLFTDSSVFHLFSSLLMILLYLFPLYLSTHFLEYFDIFSKSVCCCIIFVIFCIFRQIFPKFANHLSAIGFVFIIHSVHNTFNFCLLGH